MNAGDGALSSLSSLASSWARNIDRLSLDARHVSKREQSRAAAAVAAAAASDRSSAAEAATEMIRGVQVGDTILS
jgi:hypothetical protein